MASRPGAAPTAAASRGIARGLQHDRPAGGAGAAIHARWVGPYRLQRRVVSVPFPRLPPAFDGFRVLHLSDLHYIPGNRWLERRLAELAMQTQSDPPDVIALTGQPCDRVRDPAAELLAYVSFYDQRSGGVETSFRNDKQGLGLTHRNKKRFEAQQMVMLLSALAHNVLVWARQWLLPQCPPVRRFGILRLVRDIFHVSGFVVRDGAGRLTQVVLNDAAPLARGLAAALCQLLAPLHVAVILGKI